MRKFQVLVRLFIFLAFFGVQGLWAQLGDSNLQGDLMSALGSNDIQGAKQILKESGMFDQVKQHLESSGQIDSVRNMVNSGNVSDLKNIAIPGALTTPDATTNQGAGGEGNTSLFEMVSNPETLTTTKVLNFSKRSPYTQLFFAISVVVLLLFLPYHHIFNGFRSMLGIRRRRRRAR